MHERDQFRILRRAKSPEPLRSELRRRILAADDPKAVDALSEGFLGEVGQALLCKSDHLPHHLRGVRPKQAPVLGREDLRKRADRVRKDGQDESLFEERVDPVDKLVRKSMIVADRTQPVRGHRHAVHRLMSKRALDPRPRSESSHRGAVGTLSVVGDEAADVPPGLHVREGVVDTLEGVPLGDQPVQVDPSAAV